MAFKILKNTFYFKCELVELPVSAIKKRKLPDDTIECSHSYFTH